MNTTEMLDLLSNYIKTNFKHLPNPDWRKTNMFCPQWRQFGAKKYYQLPNGGKIIVMQWGTDDWGFDALDGFPEPTDGRLDDLRDK